MADRTGIEWTDATWNPIRGCTRVSEGCRNCYAETIAARFSDLGQPYHGLAERGRPGSKWTGKVRLVESALTLPLRWKKPRRIFVNSMSDLFHEAVPDEWIDRIFVVMALGPQHTFQILTKRPERMLAYLADERMREDIRATLIIRDDPTNNKLMWPLPNVWLGTSVENQPTADERIPFLLATPAAKRFISAEPLLGPIDLKKYVGRIIADAIGGYEQELLVPSPRLNWVIAGGESGPHARPMHPDWPRALRDQCAAACVPFFFKQWGDWAPGDGDLDGGGQQSYRIGKKAAGALLDGIEHKEFPA